ncbi:MFS transporter [Chloroflexota bacterium]
MTGCIATGYGDGVLAPLVGILVDRWGPRRLIFSGEIFAALGLFLLSKATSLPMFYGAYLLMAVGISFCTMTVLMTAIANWFCRKVGIATGIVSAGFGSGGLMIPVMVGLIEMNRWRMAVAILALGMLVIVLPLSLLFRHKPEQYGYLPDGQPEGSTTFAKNPIPGQAVEVNIEAGQALKSKTFWRMALPITSQVLLVTATMAHVMPYLSSIGIPRARSQWVATIIPLISIGGRLSFGWLRDRVDQRQLSASAFILMGLGLLCFGYAPTGGLWLLVSFLVLFGTGYGSAMVMRPALMREYFGRANFGKILGWMLGINMLGSITGPPVAGWVYDTWNSYQGIWFIFAGVALVTLLSILAVRPVRIETGQAGKP